MIINMVGGGGGAALNFKVVPGLTQPGTAAENTIWVKTERISSWYFSATQPEGLQEWDVWFQTGTESEVEFNALRKNGLQVYPLSAKQYVGGVLVDKIAKSYQDGKWVEWIRYFYKAGDEYEDVTGGWTSDGYTYPGKTPTIATKYDDYFEVNGAPNEFNVLGVDEPVNFDKLNTLYVDAEPTGTVSGVSIAVVVHNTKTAAGSSLAYLSCGSVLERSVFTIDISNITGDVYIMCFAEFSSSCSGKFYNIWAE